MACLLMYGDPRLKGAGNHDTGANSTAAVHFRLGVGVVLSHPVVWEVAFRAGPEGVRLGVVGGGWMRVFGRVSESSGGGDPFDGGPSAAEVGVVKPAIVTRRVWEGPGRPVRGR